MTHATPMEFLTIGIIGAGQMGSGIAQVLALAGYDVLLSDANDTALSASIGTINADLARQALRGRITPEASAAARSRIRPLPSLRELRRADLVIEAASESELVKQAIFRDIVPHLRPDALLATNTSSLSITRLAACTDRPERFMGVHFMNPVPVMQLVELIRGIATNQTTYDACAAMVVRLGKTATTAEDFPAFIVNRILISMINEAIYVLYEGVGSVAAIDASLKLGANHPMGPLELADFIGLDTCLAIMNVLAKGLGDNKYRPCPLLMKYVEARWLGRKSGRGFYDYCGEIPRPTRLHGSGTAGQRTMAPV